MTTPYVVTSSTNRPWDDGMYWHLEQSADEAPDFDLDPLTVAFVRDQHLRAPNGALENEYIEWLIRASYRQAEKWTNRALIPQTFRLVMSAFPWGDIYVPKAPLISASSIDYVDSGGAASLAGSPEEFLVITPSGYENKRGRIQPLAGASWPSASSPDTVTLTFIAGYPIVDGVAAIPEDINDARLLWIGERFKQRSLTDHAFNQNKAAIQARAMWMGYRIYG